MNIDVHSHAALSRDLVEGHAREIMEHMKKRLAPWAPHPILCQSEAHEEGGSIADWKRNGKSPSAAYLGASHIPMVMCSLGERALFEGASEREEGLEHAAEPTKRL